MISAHVYKSTKCIPVYSNLGSFPGFLYFVNSCISSLSNLIWPIRFFHPFAFVPSYFSSRKTSCRNDKNCSWFLGNSMWNTWNTDKNRKMAWEISPAWRWIAELSPAHSAYLKCPFLLKNRYSFGNSFRTDLTWLSKLLDTSHLSITGSLLDIFFIPRLLAM